MEWSAVEKKICCASTTQAFVIRMPNALQPVYANANKDLKETGIIVVRVSFYLCFKFTTAITTTLLIFAIIE